MWAQLLAPHTVNVLLLKEQWKKLDGWFLPIHLTYV